MDFQVASFHSLKPQKLLALGRVLTDPTLASHLISLQVRYTFTDVPYKVEVCQQAHHSKPWSSYRWPDQENLPPHLPYLPRWTQVK